ncbi:39S ribosomal protein L41, mitochondrial [Anthonomus grandis grandis]|uniref:39S ribosomal protein L41, mitochondrial n=1 Tax=Anthonomus grandis grandis TaxID=2921223 RepID=UPI0021667E38|nr:39S ribosomal protein L41, mitochondrial [Anthonomus grandis grandis]
MPFNLILKRSISTTAANLGKKNFRKFQLFNKRGTRQFKKEQLENPDLDLFHSKGVRSVGYTSRVDGSFKLIPEKIPELIVPNLEGCELKPYVSYRTPDIVQTEFTAEDLFNVVYAPKITKDFEEGKLDDNGNPLEPSLEEKLTPEEAKQKARQTGSDML